MIDGILKRALAAGLESLTKDGAQAVEEVEREANRIKTKIREVATELAGEARPEQKPQPNSFTCPRCRRQFKDAVEIFEHVRSHS